MATLVVPLIFTGIFLASVWFMNESMKARGCCMTCNGDKAKKAYLVKKVTPKDSESTSSISTNIIPGKASATCIPSLKAVAL